MTDNENKTIRYINGILKNRNIDLDYKYYEWLKSKVQEVKLTSVYSIFCSSQLAVMVNTLNPQPKMCYEISFNTAFYNSEKIRSVIGYQIMFNNLFINHAINKIIVDCETYYFDLVSELSDNGNVEDLNFVAIQDFSSDEIKYYMNRTAFPDRLPFVWYQENIYPKKIIRP